MTLLRSKPLLLFVCSWLLLPVLRAGPDAPVPKWAQEQSDIPASPRVTYGCLDNGLRYALMPNQTPPGQVSLRLLVLAGSLNEQDNELGYAHFVEHMAFRSTRSFPADEKVTLVLMPLSVHVALLFQFNPASAMNLPSRMSRKDVSTMGTDVAKVKPPNSTRNCVG